MSERIKFTKQFDFMPNAATMQTFRKGEVRVILSAGESAGEDRSITHAAAEAARAAGVFEAAPDGESSKPRTASQEARRSAAESTVAGRGSPGRGR